MGTRLRHRPWKGDECVIKLVDGQGPLTVAFDGCVAFDRGGLKTCCVKALKGLRALPAAGQECPTCGARWCRTARGWRLDTTPRAAYGARTKLDDGPVAEERTDPIPRTEGAE